MAKKPSKPEKSGEIPAMPVRKAAGKSASKPRGGARSVREVELKPVSAASPRLRVPAPMALGAVLGQDRAVGVLRRALGSGRVHHAWVFHGPAGVGKFTTALALAAVLLDPEARAGLSGELEVDPESATQRLLRAGTHPDLHVITKELALVSREASVRDSKQKTIAKEVLEEFLIEPSTRTSSGGGAGAQAGQVYIVDEAELIDARGQNALLKTLEEPAPGRVIILVTSREERLLPTIRSRCQRVGFGPLDDAAMKAWARGAGVDLATMEAGEYQFIMGVADGSPGMVELARGTGLSAWNVALGPMLAELDRGVCPAELGVTMAKLIDDWASAWVERPENEGASKDAANKAAARLMFRVLGMRARRRLRELDGGVPRALRAIELIVEAERQVEANVQALFALENLVGQLAEAR